MRTGQDLCEDRQDRLARQEAGTDANGQVGQAGHLSGLDRIYVKTGRTANNVSR